MTGWSLCFLFCGTRSQAHPEQIWHPECLRLLGCRDDSDGLIKELNFEHENKSLSVFIGRLNWRSGSLTSPLRAGRLEHAVLMSAIQCPIKETGIPAYQQPRDLPNQKSSISNFVKERALQSSRARHLEPGDFREASEEAGSQYLNWNSTYGYNTDLIVCMHSICHPNPTEAQWYDDNAKAAPKDTLQVWSAENLLRVGLELNNTYLNAIFFVIRSFRSISFVHRDKRLYGMTWNPFIARN